MPEVTMIQAINDAPTFTDGLGRNHFKISNPNTSRDAACKLCMP